MHYLLNVAPGSQTAKIPPVIETQVEFISDLISRPTTASSHCSNWFPNLYLKFSSVNLYSARRGKSTPKEFFTRLIDRFGARRLMWGSNFPATHDRSLKDQFDLARQELSFLPQEDQRWIFGETALTLWPMLR